MVRSLVELSLDKQSFGMSSLTLTPPRQGFILDSEKTFTAKFRRAISKIKGMDL